MVYTEEPRDDALLTKGQRAFLMSDGSGLSRQAQHNHRKAIRKRVKNSLYDFGVLWDQWPEEEREEVMKELEIELADKDLPGGTILPPSTVLSDIISFVYLFAGDSWQPFKNILQTGVSRAVSKKFGGEMRANVNYEEEIHQMGGIHFGSDSLKLLEEGRINELSDQEIRSFVEWFSDTELFDPKKIRELKIEEHPRPDENGTGKD